MQRSSPGEENAGIENGVREMTPEQLLDWMDRNNYAICKFKKRNEYGEAYFRYDDTPREEALDILSKIT